jgi:hypothetical protein
MSDLDEGVPKIYKAAAHLPYIQIVTVKSSSGNFYNGCSEPTLFLTYTPNVKNPSAAARCMTRLFFW